MGKNILPVLKTVVACVALLLFLGLSGGSIMTAPENAVVYIKQESKTYISPPCTSEDEIERFITSVADSDFLLQTTLVEARQSGYKPDTECVNMSGFMQEGRSLTGTLFESLGVLQPLPSRWNEDGTWNW